MISQSTSLFMLEQNSNQPIRSEGQEYGLSSLGLQPGLGIFTSVLFTNYLTLILGIVYGKGFVTGRDMVRTK